MNAWFKQIKNSIDQFFTDVSDDGWRVNGVLVKDTEKEVKKIMRWAQKRGFSRGGAFKAEYVPPLIDWSSDLLVDHHISGQTNGYGFQLFRYNNITHLRDFSIPYRQWIIYFELKHALPGCIIDGKNSSHLSRRFTDAEELKLEGKFAEKFSVFVPKGEHIDVLSVVTPDIMWELFSKYSEVDVIIADKKLWVIARNKFDILPVVDKLLEAAGAMVVRLERRARTYRED